MHEFDQVEITQAEAQRQVANEVAAFFLIGTIVYLAGVAAFGG